MKIVKQFTIQEGDVSNQVLALWGSKNAGNSYPSATEAQVFENAVKHLEGKYGFRLLKAENLISSFGILITAEMNHSELVGIGATEHGDTVEVFISEIENTLDGGTKDTLYPKNITQAKTYKTWTRKGNCPGCRIGTGSKHREGCPTRKSLLRQIGK